LLHALTVCRVAKKEEVAEEGKKKKGGIQIPEEWPWEEAKKLFEEPDVTPADQIELDWKEPDVDGLVEFMVTQKGFSEDRIRKGAEKLAKAVNAKQQGRIDGFFVVQPKAKEGDTKKGKGAKNDIKPKGTGKRKLNKAEDAGSSKRTKK